MHRLPRRALCTSYCTAALDTIACATALQRASSRQFGSGQGAARCWRRCWSRALSRSCMRESGIIIPRRDRQRRTQGFTTTEFHRDEACCSSRCRRVARQLRVGRLVVWFYLFLECSRSCHMLESVKCDVVVYPTAAAVIPGGVHCSPVQFSAV